MMVDKHQNIIGLRDRIATALGGELHVNLLGNGYDVEDLLALADTVIESLNFDQEWMEHPHSDNQETRWVTEWVDATMKHLVVSPWTGEKTRGRA